MYEQGGEGGEEGEREGGEGGEGGEQGREEGNCEVALLPHFEGGGLGDFSTCSIKLSETSEK